MACKCAESAVPDNDREVLPGQACVRPVEVVCDESGFEGTKLVGGATDVFCHASIDLTEDEAAACVRNLRTMIRSPASEYKAGHLLREKNRRALAWFLGAAGPVIGHANAYLVDKRYLLLIAFASRLVNGGPFGADPQVRELGVSGIAAALYRASTKSQAWTTFLIVLNDLLRPRRMDEAVSTDTLVMLLDALRAGRSSRPAHDILELLARRRVALDKLLSVSAPADPTVLAAMVPLIPAILRAIDHWGADGAPVSIVHDRHVMLTDARIAEIMALRSGTGPGGRLSALHLVSSAADVRVQVADYLAGVARKLASDELAGTADPELTALLRRYVDSRIVWGDEESRLRLCPLS